MKYRESKSQGQSAVEYLIIFSAALALFVSVTFTQMINPSSEAANDSLYLSQAKTAVDAIAGSINAVYANGLGAVKSATVQIDRDWAIQLDNVKNVARITVRISTGSENLEDSLLYKMNYYHSLPNLSAGTYTVIVEWPENETAKENVYGGATTSKKIYIYIKPGGK